METEAHRLETIAADSWYAKGANAASVRHSARIFRRFWRGPRCLEMGPAEGVMTELLAGEFPRLTLVEGSERFCRDLAARHPQAAVVNSLFETFATAERFDTIVLGHVLEHVEDPRSILRAARGWLQPGGVICAAVPNARSIHRQAGVLMGLLSTVYDFNEADRHHGHRRVYDPEGFRADFEAAGLVVERLGGYWMKPVSNAQIEAEWSPELLAAYMELGEHYPDIAGEIYVIAKA